MGILDTIKNMFVKKGKKAAKDKAKDVVVEKDKEVVSQETEE